MAPPGGKYATEQVWCTLHCTERGGSCRSSHEGALKTQINICCAGSFLLS